MIFRPERWQTSNTAVEHWSNGFCTTDWCQGERWMVRRDTRHPDLWLVAESADAAGWQIAAIEPICPLCGMELSPHIEGVGDVPDVDNNPLAAYARRLVA